MRHHNNNRKFGRSTNQRKALMRSLARALVIYEKIQTTEAKAKELRPYIEKIITQSSDDTVSNRRMVAREFSGSPQIIKKLFTEIAPRYKDRQGGYTRIIKLSEHFDDARKTAQIELV